MRSTSYRPVIFGEEEQTSSISWELGRTANSQPCNLESLGARPTLSFNKPSRRQVHTSLRIAAPGSAVELLVLRRMWKPPCTGEPLHRHWSYRTSDRWGDPTRWYRTGTGTSTTPPDRNLTTAHWVAEWFCPLVCGCASRPSPLVASRFRFDRSGVGPESPFLTSFYTINIAWIARVYILNQWLSKILVSGLLYM